MSPSAPADSCSITPEMCRLGIPLQSCFSSSEPSARRCSSLGSVPRLPTIRRLASLPMVLPMAMAPVTRTASPHGAGPRGTCGGRLQQDEEEPEAEAAPGPRAPLAAHGRCPGAAARRPLAAPNGRAASASPGPFLPCRGGGGFPGGPPSSVEAREGGRLSHPQSPGKHLPRLQLQRQAPGCAG